MAISLAQPSSNSQGGLVTENGSFYSLDASVTGSFNLAGIEITATGLGIDYIANQDGSSTEFAMYGSVSIASSFLNFSTTLGTQQSPGLVISDGKLQTLDISVTGGFSLFGFQVQANGLTIQYSSSSNELELSGGIMLDFTHAFGIRSHQPGGAVDQYADGSPLDTVDWSPDHCQRDLGRVLDSKPDDLLQQRVRRCELQAQAAMSICRAA